MGKIKIYLLDTNLQFSDLFDPTRSIFHGLKLEGLNYRAMPNPPHLSTSFSSFRFVLRPADLFDTINEYYESYRACGFMLNP